MFDLGVTREPPQPVSRMAADPSPWKKRAAQLPFGHVILRLVRSRRNMWSYLRPRLLAELGKVPSHALRNYFYRRSGVTLPHSSSLHGRATIYAPEGIVVGQNCTIGDNCILDGRAGITFGDNVNVGAHVAIYTREHDVDSPDFAEVGAPVRIGSYAWLASHSVILPGVTVGEGAVVAAGAVVSRNVAPYTLVGGNPAQVIRERSRDLHYQLGYARRFA